MDIYENVVIGSFLFGLGLKMGIGSGPRGSEPTSVSLFQQTPLDRPLADLLFANPRIIRIFEFKRRGNDSDKEVTKRGLLEDALSSPGMAPLAELSREIHWYIESDYGHSGGNTLVMSYLDFPAPPFLLGMTAFIDNLVREAAADKDDLKLARSKDYLTALKTLAAGVDGGSGTFIVSITGGGALKFVHLPDVRELFMTPQQIIDRRQALEAERVMARSRRRERSRSRGISRGIGD